MRRIPPLLLATLIALTAGAQAFADGAIATRVTGTTSRPVHPQVKCWPHIYNAGIAKGHDAALAAAEANLICGGGDPR